jgi:hypothetical protein
LRKDTNLSAISVTEQQIIEYLQDYFSRSENQLPKGFSPDDIVRVKGAIFDADKTLTIDGKSGISEDNLREIVRALELDIPILIISGSPLIPEESVKLYNSDGSYEEIFVSFRDEALKVRVIPGIVELLQKHNRLSAIKNLTVQGIGGAETITFDEIAQQTYVQDESKLIRGNDQIRFGKALAIGCLEVLGKNKQVDFSETIRQIKELQSFSDIKQLLENTVKPYTDARFWPFNSEIALVALDKNFDCSDIMNKALNSGLVDNYNFNDKNGRFFCSGGTDFCKFTKMKKANSAKKWIDCLEGKGAILGFGDSLTDDFLWGISDEPYYFPMYLGKEQDVDRWQKIITVRDEKGNDNVQSKGSGLVLGKFLDAHCEKLPYRMVKFINGQISYKKLLDVQNKQEILPHTKVSLVGFMSSGNLTKSITYALYTLSGNLKRFFGPKVDVAIHDMYADHALNHDAVIQEIMNDVPHVLGLSIVPGSLYSAKKLYDEIINRIPEEKRPLIVLGNSLPGYLTELMLKKYFSEAIIVKGDGEKALIGLVEYVKGDMKNLDMLYKNLKNPGSISVCSDISDSEAIFTLLSAA